MEDENIDQQDQARTETHASGKSLKETLKSGSPDEVRDRMKDVVEKGVAAVAGALKGFADQTERAKVPEMSKNAVHQAGETIRSTASSVTEEAKNLKEPLKEAGHKLSETARDLRSSAQDEYRGTRDAIKGTGTMTGTGSGSLSEGTLGGSPSDIGPTGSSLGRTSRGSLTESGESSTGLGSEMPDISHTPLAQSDRKLQGKDLLSDIEDDRET